MTTIVHISDLHFPRVVPGQSDALLRALRELRADCVIASGDFTMTGRRREFAAAAGLLDRLGVPVIACPGNHDIPAFNLMARFLRPLERYNHFIAPRTFASTRIGDAAIIALSSPRSWDLSLNWSHGRLSNEQVDEAAAFFREHHEAPTKLLVTHHPFAVPGDLPSFRRIGNADAALQMASVSGVDAILTGHLHRQFATTVAVAAPPFDKGILLLNAGTTLSDRARDEQNGFLVLHCDDTGISETTSHVFQKGEFVRTALDGPVLTAHASHSRSPFNERRHHEPEALAKSG